MSRPRKILQASAAGDAPWQTLTVADATQAIGAPVDPNGIIATSDETAGVWSMTCDQDGFLPREEADEMGRWMFDPFVLGGLELGDGTTGIAFRFTPTVWPAAGTRVCVGFGVITANGTSIGLNALAIGLDDFDGSNDQVGVCIENPWTVADTFAGRVTSVRGLWVPNGNPNTVNIGSFDVQAIRTTAGSPPFTQDTHLQQAQGATPVEFFRMFIGFGFRDNGGQSGVAVAGTFEARPVVLFPGWPEA